MKNTDQNHTRSGTGATIQREMGRYVSGDDASPISEDGLKSVGLQLMIQATGHRIDNNAENLDAVNARAPLEPSAAQLTGLPVIDIVDLRAGNVPIATDILGSIDQRRTDYVNQETDDRAFAGKSYGVLNSHIEPFGGAAPIGMIATANVAIGSIIAFAAVPSALIRSVTATTSNGNVPNPREPWNLEKGSHNTRSNTLENVISSLFEYLGIPRTNFDVDECLRSGMDAFFGQGGGNVQTAPGYYAVIVRNAVRDTQQIVESTQDLGSSPENLASVASNVFSFFDSIISSSTYRFITAMIVLGNQVLTRRLSLTNESISTPLSDVPSLRLRSRISPRRDSAVSENLSAEGDLGSNQATSLAWKHSAPMSKYILPDNFRAASNVYRSSIDSNLPAPMTGNRFAHKSRLTGDEVQVIENSLQGEYMPFYFQDLRTNEILSFQAFLTDLSDGFTASYNSTSGYGRIEDVMVYNNTKRSISFTFFVAATSKKDHNVMYWNINKLVSMLYPQFSRGRSMVNGETKFIQPFSQIPTASPMIRLRIGDVIKGNYSKFGIARLFGLGRPDFEVSVEAGGTTGNTSRDEAIVAVDRRLRESAAFGWQVDDEVEIQPYSAREGADTIVNSRGETLSSRWTSETTTPGRDDAVDRLASGWSRGAEESITKIKILQVDPAVASIDMNFARYTAQIIETSARDEVHLERDLVFGTSPDESAFNRLSINHDSILRATTEWREQLIDRETGGQGSSADEEEESDIASNRDAAVSTFFSAGEGNSGNPIIRAFESTRGRGLAGFITDLKMDWADAPWEIAEGSRAPIFMKLAVTFSPIHDIPLGLDSDGMMRSVAYNVGDLSRVVGSDPYDRLPETDNGDAE